MVRRCKKCHMLTSKPGVKLDAFGVCQACRHAENRKDVDYRSRRERFSKWLDGYRKSDGSHDCIIPVSGGKDSTFQVYLMKELYKMNPLLVTVTDIFSHTNAGTHNLQNLAETFGCDSLVLNINPKTIKSLSRDSFESFGSTNWGVDLGIYGWPLQVAIEKNIKLVCYGEDVVYHFGGVFDEETPSAMRQIQNDIVSSKGYKLLENYPASATTMLKYPSKETIKQAGLEPIFLGYFHPWWDRARTDMIYKWGFHDLHNEWQRKGYPDDFVQIDSVGYLVNYLLKYIKLGIGRYTDICAQLLREGRMSSKRAAALINRHDHEFDWRIVDDFCNAVGYTVREFWDIADGFWNQDVFDYDKYGVWKIKPHLKAK